MTETDPTSLAPARLDGKSKLFAELGPLVAFGIGYLFQGRLGEPVDSLLGTTMFAGEGRELYLAVLFSLPAFALAIIYSAVRVKRVAPMLLVSGFIVAVLGALTFIFDSKTFVYMKPTIIYALTAAVLAGGMLTGRVFLKILFDGAFALTDHAWRVFTWRFVAFNAITALANEILWRTLTADCLPDAECPGEGTWVSIKLFGFTAAYFVFIAANFPFLLKHMVTDEAPETSKPVDGI